MSDVQVSLRSFKLCGYEPQGLFASVQGLPVVRIHRASQGPGLLSLLSHEFLLKHADVLATRPDPL